MGIALWIIIGIASLAVLVKAADYFIEGAEALGAHFRVRPFVLGVFLLGLGTSLPELILGTLAAAENATELVVGNVLGANTANMLLLLGVSALIAGPAKINFNVLEFDLPLFVVSAFLLAVTIWDGKFTALEGMFLLAVFVLYVAYTFAARRKEQRLIPREIRELPRDAVTWRDILKLVISPVAIYFSARYTIEAVLVVSHALSIGADIIAATAVSLGTTLPEFAVSYAAVRRGKIDEMLGNIIGSNIFNALVVMSIPSLIRTLVVPAEMTSTALPLMIVATAVAFIVIRDKKITKWEGTVLIVLYLAFLGTLWNVF